MPVVDVVTVYVDANGEYRWTAKARNNETVADSSEGYKNWSHAERMAHELFPNASVVLDINAETRDE